LSEEEHFRVAENYLDLGSHGPEEGWLESPKNPGLMKHLFTYKFTEWTFGMELRSSTNALTHIEIQLTVVVFEVPLHGSWESKEEGDFEDALTKVPEERIIGLDPITEEG
jgi:hypothetical protein